jgi:DNA invertase Pin-like site-specific DNA recombinase
MPHIAIYVRVSSASQSTASQEPDLKRWEQGHSVPVTWYRDVHTGTGPMDRPGWNKLQAALEAGSVSTICCWRLDRLGRTSRGLAELFEDLVRRKVNLVSLREGVDISTPAGRMVAHVIASMAQFETELRSERIAAGMAAAKARGVPFGRPPGTHTRVKVTHEQETLIRRLKGEGETITGIARSTGLSRPTIYSVLRA